MAAARRGGGTGARGNAGTKTVIARRAVCSRCLCYFRAHQTLAGSGRIIIDRVVRAHADGETNRGVRETLSLGEPGRPPLFPRPAHASSTRYRIRAAPGGRAMSEPRSTGTGDRRAAIQV